MKILITGGSGFIGSHLVEHYQHQAEVVVLDNFKGRKNGAYSGWDSFCDFCAFLRLNHSVYNPR
jgi:nucleoside-diphosphate-sugar epimerase